jgi:Pentapeptide repeats (9 copies)
VAHLLDDDEEEVRHAPACGKSAKLIPTRVDRLGGDIFMRLDPKCSGEMMLPSNRTRIEDARFDVDISDVNHSNHLFVRVVAKGRLFTRVDFRWSIFDSSYLRNCKFVSCDFTGCRFISNQFHGSSFSLCKFDYATFERTYIDDQILVSESPHLENIRMRFARTLRMNYQQTGDARAVNRAMRVELEAQKTHLYKAWRSEDSYFRLKYKGGRRVAMFLDWSRFKILDLVWGNGESLLKLGRAILVVLLAIALYDIVMFRDHWKVYSYLRAIVEAPQEFFGVRTPIYFSHSVLTAIVASRLLMFGLFTSIVVKRYNRR